MKNTVNILDLPVKKWMQWQLIMAEAINLGRSGVNIAYMTGILPIKKYGTQEVNSAESGRETRLGGLALNIFDEFSMTNPDVLTEFVGFTFTIRNRSLMP